MSRLIDSIRKLGQQSSQPLGFGALTRRSETPRTLALIGRTTPGDAASDLKKIDSDVLDAVILDTEDPGSVDAAVTGDLIWGVASSSLDDEDVESLIARGCDFFVIEPASAPASLASQVDQAIVVELDDPLERETTLALRALNIDGSLNASAIGSGSLTFQDLIRVHRTAASTGGVMLVQLSGDIGVPSLAALRDTGVDGLVASLSDSDHVAETGRKIRELPPRKRAEPRGLPAAAPQTPD